jgi:RNA polymerase sigma factor, TIGR02999 family
MPGMSSGPEKNHRDEVTRLLVQWGNGDKAALDALTPILYRELHQLAEAYLRRERIAATLQPTALVHEAYLRLVAQNLPDWECRSHFFGVAAQLMRQILVDNARKHRSDKRGGDAIKVPLDEAWMFSEQRSAELIALDDALRELAAFDERKSKVMELRFFGGLSAEETAQSLNISVATVGREQRLAEAWLHRQLNPEQSR